MSIWVQKIVESEIVFRSSGNHFPQPLDGSHGLGGLVVFHFFVVFYDLFYAYAELVDFHGPTFSFGLNIAFIDPIVLTQCTHCYTHFWLPQTCGRLNVSGRAFLHFLEICYQPGHVPVHAQALQALYEF